MTQKTQGSPILEALPFWLSLTLLPMVAIAAYLGSWWVLIVPVFTWGLFSILDALMGLNEENQDPDTPRDSLSWYRAITLIWFPLQALMIFGTIAYVSGSDMGTWEKIGLFFGVGVVSGTVGINYSHELMHQRGKLERWLADLLLASVLYSHFRSEHLLVHHRYVGTPKDPVTARYNEGFHRFYPRVLKECWHSAFNAEKAMLARKNKPWHDLSNPFFRYWGLQIAMLLLAFVIGGWSGLGLFLVQAGVAIWQLELVNYVEHYGLTRRHLGDGKYEHVQPHHSWNAAYKASNWLLINLQRHSDHHYKPERPFPLLQNYDEKEAPQLPFGYPVMTALAMCPPLWRKYMNAKVRDWQAQYYPDIEDWTPYKEATNPLPR